MDGAEQDSCLLHDCLWSWTRCSKTLAATGPGRRVDYRPVRRLQLYRPKPAPAVLAHVARNVAPIAESVERVNQPIGARLLLLAETVFWTRHRWDNGQLSKTQYLRRLRHCRQSWLNHSWSKACYCVPNAIEDAVSTCSRMTLLCCGSSLQMISP